MNNFSMNVNTNKFLLLCEENNYNNVLNFYNNNPKIDIHFNNEEAFRIFCLKGNLDLIKWILRVDPELNILVNNAECFHILCKHGHYSAFLWLYLKYGNNNSINNTFLLFINACKGNNLKLIKYIFSIFKEKLGERIQEIVVFICKSGNLEILKYIISELNTLDKYNNYLLLENCYISENLEIITYMTKLIEDENNFKEKYKIFLLEVIPELSNLDILKWFVNKYNITDITFDTNSVFFNTLHNENFEILNYLLLNYPDIVSSIKNNQDQYDRLINIIITNDLIELKTLEIILENFNNFDIFTNDHYFFRINCESNNSDIIKFMSNKYPEIYNASIINNEIIDWYINRKVEVSDKIIEMEIQTCPICITNNSNIISSCSHQFCLDCIKKVYERSRKIISCPLCRSEIKFFNSLINK